MPEEDAWLFVPNAFIGQQIGGRKKPHSVLLIESMIYSLSNAADGRYCRRSYSEIRERLGVCNDTIARSVGLLEANGAIVLDKGKKPCNAYTHTAPTRALSGIEVPEFLLHAEFTFRGKKKRDGTVLPSKTRTLKPMEAVILCEIRRAQKNGATDYATSDSRLARKFGVNKSTVSEYISALLRCDLLTRPKEGRGCNGNYLSRYSVSETLLRKLRKKIKRAQKAVVPTGAGSRSSPRGVPETDERTERERWYAIRRQTAEDRAARYLAQAEQDEAYNAAQRKIKRLEIDIAKAEVFRLPDLERLKQRRLEQAVVCANRLAVLHIAETDLRPAWHCNRCEDTGFDIKTKRLCTCYSPPKRGGV